MPRQTYAVTDEALAGLGGQPAVGQQLQVWTARTGGQRITSLYDLADDPLGDTLVTDDRGRFAFRADHDGALLWVRHGSGQQVTAWACIAVEATEDSARFFGQFPGIRADSAAAVEAAEVAETAADRAVTESGQALDQVGTAAQLTRDWAFTPPRLIADGPNPYNAWPQIMEADDGAILVAHSSGIVHRVGDAYASVVFTRLNRQGRAWNRVAEVGWTERHRSVFALGRRRNPSLGHIFAIVRESGIDDDDCSDWVHRVYRSTDEGRTWAEFGQPYRWPVQPMSVFGITDLANGDLLCAWSSTTGREGRATRNAWGILRSTDGGGTWTQQVVADIDTANPTGEIRLWQAPTGHILALGRHDNREGSGVWQAWSSDNGQTWTNWVRGGITDAYQTPVAPVGNTDLLTVYYLDRASGQVRKRTASAAALRTNPVTAWSATTVIHDLTTVRSMYDFGYLSAWQQANGDHRLAFYAGYRTPGIYTMHGSRMPSRLAASQPVRQVDSLSPQAGDQISTNTDPNGGDYVTAVAPPPELLVAGRVLIRWRARLRSSLGGTVYLRAFSGGQKVETEVTVPAGEAVDHDSGWLTVPDDFGQGGGALPFDQSLITWRVAVSPGAGQCTVLQVSRMLIGVRS